ncbi:Protease 2 [Sesamum angolense]|uniref:Prolyl endopeptidase-like n=1 Tax=Sesamum angolense TaxID=2727404 RepID=A0AAE1XEC5_9LAMI|nr:Protease 2 [Sesamum angolense]
MFASQLLKILQTVPSELKHESCKEIYELDDSKRDTTPLAFDAKGRDECWNPRVIDNFSMGNENGSVDSPRKKDQNGLSHHLGGWEKDADSLSKDQRTPQYSLKVEEVMHGNGNESIDSSTPCNVASLFATVTSMFTDKNVMECELPELEVCYKEINHQIVDICVDEGRRVDKELLVSDRIEASFMENANGTSAVQCGSKEENDGKLVDQGKLESPSDSSGYKDTAKHCDPVQTGQANCDVTTGMAVTDSSEEVSLVDRELPIQEFGTRSFLRSFLNSLDGEENKVTQPPDQALQITIESRCVIRRKKEPKEDVQASSLLYNSKVESGSITFNFNSPAPVLAGITNRLTENVKEQSFDSGGDMQELKDADVDNLPDGGQVRCTGGSTADVQEPSLIIKNGNSDGSSTTSHVPPVGIKERSEENVHEQTPENKDDNSTDLSQDCQLQFPNNKSQSSRKDDVQALELNVPRHEHRNSGNGSVVSQLQYDAGETSFSAAGLISYSGPIAFSGSLSHRSDGSTTSGRSFAFPVLQSEWNSSPVRMAKADRRRFRKHKGWRLGLLCFVVALLFLSDPSCVSADQVKVARISVQHVQNTKSTLLPRKLQLNQVQVATVNKGSADKDFRPREKFIEPSSSGTKQHGKQENVMELGARKGTWREWVEEGTNKSEYFSMDYGYATVNTHPGSSHRVVLKLPPFSSPSTPTCTTTVSMEASRLLSRKLTKKNFLPFNSYLFPKLASSALFSTICRRQFTPALPQPPAAKKVPFTATAHGVTWKDPYHWMSDINDPDFISYLNQENSYAEAFMQDTLNMRRILYSEMVSRIPSKISTPPERWGPCTILCEFIHFLAMVQVYIINATNPQAGLQSKVKNFSDNGYYLARCVDEDVQSRNLQNVIMAGEDTCLEDMDIFNGHLKEMVIDDLDPWYFPLPSNMCTVTPGSNHDFMNTVYRVVLSSPVMPDLLVDYDMSRKIFSIVQQEDVKIFQQVMLRFSGKYICEGKEVLSHDGVKIPLTILFSRSAYQKGQSPGLLQGYGAYGEVLDKSWCPDRLSLLDRGWMFAFADVRGGAGSAPSWHRSGRGLNKLNSIHDFIACGEYLINEGFIHKNQLSALGISAGCLLVGAAVNMHPQLFRAAILKVPFLDVLNTLLDPNLPLTTLDYEEFGNPQTKCCFDYILKYSPYNNVPRGICCPAMLVSASLNDSRVGVWEAAKWVAKIRDTACSSCSSSVILQTNTSGGHFQEGGRFAHCWETACEYAFLMKVMGATEKQDMKKELLSSKSIISRCRKLRLPIIAGAQKASSADAAIMVSLVWTDGLQLMHLWPPPTGSRLHFVSCNQFKDIYVDLLRNGVKNVRASSKYAEKGENEKASSRATY